jgi:hypothetical protein
MLVDYVTLRDFRIRAGARPSASVSNTKDAKDSAVDAQSGALTILSSGINHPSNSPSNFSLPYQATISCTASQPRGPTSNQKR